MHRMEVMNTRDLWHHPRPPMTSSTPIRRWAAPLAVSAYITALLAVKVVPILQIHIVFFAHATSVFLLIAVLGLIALWTGLVRLGRQWTARERAFARTAWTGIGTFAIVLSLMRTL